VADSSVVFTGGDGTGTGAPPVSGAGGRMMWYADKLAFRAGGVSGNDWNKDSVGQYSAAFGSSKAKGYGSFASGIGSNAEGYYSTALGYESWAYGDRSLAAGSLAYAGGEASISLGLSTMASGYASFSSGAGSSATAFFSTAMGYNATASGYASYASGAGATASNANSVAIGQSAVASATNAISLGTQTIASGNYSAAFGYLTTAGGASATTLGTNTTAGGSASTAMGNGSVANGTNATATGHNTEASGNNATAMGYFTTASGANSTALGNRVSTAGYEGAFGIGDNSTSTNVNSSANNQMTMRFAGGYRLFSDAAATVGVSLAPGGNSWATISDVRKKENFSPVNGEEFLSKISKFNLTSWNYKGQDPTLFRHYGPMAQDFYAAFGKDNYGTVGNDTTINQADMEGVSFVAIQALVKRTEELMKEVSVLKAENKSVITENYELKAALTEQNKTILSRMELLEAEMQKNKFGLK
ncbi:MAG: tail fiber domain-containing protein, partial [Taibaiella sp.]|nr:tail fiber domain-containing protein [Taibaiella sp.]